MEDCIPNVRGLKTLGVQLKSLDIQEFQSVSRRSKYLKLIYLIGFWKTKSETRKLKIIERRNAKDESETSNSKYVAGVLPAKKWNSWFREIGTTTQKIVGNSRFSGIGTAGSLVCSLTCYGFFRFKRHRI